VGNTCCVLYWIPDGNEIWYAGSTEVNTFASSGIYRLTANMSDEANVEGEDTSLCSLADGV